MKKTTKLLATILAIILVLSMIPMTAMAADGEATTEKDPLAVSTPQEFLAMTSGNSYYLTNDIDFTGVTLAKEYMFDSFYGSIDGRGYSIYGYELNYTTNSSVCNAAIFKILGGTAITTITNLNIGKPDAPVKINVDDTTASSNREVNASFLAAAIGKNFSVVIDNVNVYGEAVINSKYEVRMGGLAGYGRDLAISNCTINGTITVNNNAVDKYKFIGGMVALEAGDTGHTIVIENCTNNANITLTNTAGTTSGEACVGGMIGASKIPETYIKDCTNNGNLTSEKFAGGMAALLAPNVNANVTAYIIACENNGTVSAKNTAGDIYGYKKLTESTKTLRLAVIDCKNNGAASTQNLPVYDANTTYADNLSYVMPIASAADLALIGTNDAYPENGYYIVTDDIDLSSHGAYSTYVITSFSGVFYGNGKTIKGLTLSAGNASLAFFGSVALNGHAVICDLSFGSADAPTKVITGAGNSNRVAVVASNLSENSGNTDSTFDTVISDVNVYVDMDHTPTTSSVQLSGIAARSRCATIIDTNVYGSIYSNTNNTSNAYINATGFIAVTANGTRGNNSNRKQIILHSNNYADITLDVKFTSDLRASGFLGYHDAKNTAILNCNNFGDMYAPASNVKSNACGFAAVPATNNQTTVGSCMNFGDINAYYAGVAIAYANGTHRYVFSVTNYGTVTQGYTSGDNYRNEFVCWINTNKLSMANLTNEVALSAIDGASIRLDPARTGIRFMTQINPATIAKLEAAYGEGSVSYGTIIAPDVFIASAGAFTTEALDKFAETKGTFGDDKAYVDVPATKWFDGNEGLIAGSIVGLENMYKVAFSGRGYIRVTVDGNEIVTLYSDYSADKNSRTVEYVANAALADLLYVKNDTYYKLVNGEYVEYTKDDKATYVTNLGEADGYVKYSCYTTAQIETLNIILGK